MLNIDTKTKAKLAWVGTLLAPVIVVQGVRGVVGAGAAPSAASAAAINTAPVVAAPASPEKPLTPGQKKAREWLAARTPLETLRSPMDRFTESDGQPPGDRIKPAPKPSPVIVEAPKVTLTAMIASQSDNGRPMTVINDRMYRVGDSISPHWRVAGIDTRRRIVTLVGPDNRILELQPPTPALERE